MLSFRFLKDWLLTAIQMFGQHNCGQLAASISYYVLFSIFPLLIFLVAVVGIFLNESAQADVVDEVMSVFPLSEDGGREDVAGAYSIADMAIYPWLRRVLARFEGFENVRRWASTVAERPATIRAYEKGAAINTVPTINKESKALLLGLTGGNAGDTRDRKAA